MPTKRLEHVTETYRNDESSRLIRVEAYYRNDTRTGVGVIIEGTDLTLFDEMMRHYEEAWREADTGQREEIVKAYFRQLNAWGLTQASDRSDRDNYLCALNIAFLEQKDYLQGDQYNGCRFTYEVSPDRLDDLLDGVVDWADRPGGDRDSTHG